MDNDWYLLEFAIHTQDGHVHERADWYPDRSQASIAMHQEIAMGEWDTWRMTRRPRPAQAGTRSALATGHWHPTPLQGAARQEGPHRG